MWPKSIIAVRLSSEARGERAKVSLGFSVDGNLKSNSNWPICCGGWIAPKAAIYLSFEAKNYLTQQTRVAHKKAQRKLNQTDWLIVVWWSSLQNKIVLTLAGANIWTVAAHFHFSIQFNLFESKKRWRKRWSKEGATKTVAHVLTVTRVNLKHF